MRFSFKRLEPAPHIYIDDWNSWAWQLKNALKSEADFKQFFLGDVSTHFQQIPFKIKTTPYYASLALNQPAEDPIRKILFPDIKEIQSLGQSLEDPLGEKRHNPVPRVIHRYPDRLLLLITDQCSVYCRYCTRKHFTGKEQAFLKETELEKALAYIGNRPGVREVILSGGDPLTVNNERLDRILFALRKLENIEIIRVATRFPVVAPMRFDEDLLKIFKRHKPVFLMTHFNHPRELTEQAATALENLVDHGVPVFNQMVLLNGVNNHPAIVQALSRRLLFLRAKPYYMFHCDPSEGSQHFRTSVDNSLEIQRELWGRLSGLAVPNLSLDIPGGGGKVGLTPNFEIARDGQKRFYRGWDGYENFYESPTAEEILTPIDAQDYLPEWDQIKNSLT